MPGYLNLFGDKLPGDVRVQSYRAREGVSLPYSIELEISTQDTSFRVEDCLRTRVLLEAIDGHGGARHFDGLPDRVGFLAHRGDDLFFHLRLRPALAALEHREGSRIFQDKSVVDVVKEILKDAGVDDHVEWRLRGSYTPREFICQYRETEINFIQRLMEEEGIFYFFLHSTDHHNLVFADDPGAFTAQDGIEPMMLAARQGGVPGTRPVMGFSRRKTLRPTEVAFRDYDFEKPEKLPAASLPAEGQWAISHFEYPGGFKDSADGERKIKGRISALRADVDICRGRTRAAGLVPGTPMKVDGAREAYLNGEYIVTELSSDGEHGGETSNNAFSAVPKDAPFAAPRRAKKPKIRGLQTVVVTGPSNEPQAIHVDKYGRIKVRFLWDRSGKQDDKSSCWLRVSQAPLGGSMILPRVGWEMAVAFLDGDPDRPIVLGRSYNAENTPPYAQPGAAADGSLKSMSTPGGAGSNEFKMGDSAGSQGFAISAKKDLNVTTANDKNETVAVDEETSVGSNYKIVIGSNETTTITGSQSVDVGNALQVKVKGSQSTTVGGSEDMHAKCDYVENVGGTRDYKVGGNQITISCGVRQQITGDWKREVGSLHANVSLASIDDNMLDTYDEKASAVIVQLVAGPVAETVTTDKDQTSAAAALHVVSALTTSAKGVKQLVGGVHLQKIAGDLVVKAPKIILGGGVGKFNAAGSSIVLNGGPVTLKGSKIAIEAAVIVKLASDLKIG